MVVVGVETEQAVLLQVFVEEKVYVVLGVVYQTKRRYRARLQAKILLHALWRCKREFSLMQALLQVVNVEVALAVKHNKIVSVTLVVTEEEVLAML